MASAAEIKRSLLQLQRKDGNKVCMDCQSPNPQWASVSLTTFFCLNCSGQHRGLGVHLSFVRSITMDKWTAEQLKRMELGGNKAALEFFKSQSGYSDGMSIKDKYSSRFAELWRQKLTAECEGRVWKAPLATEPISPAARSNSSSPAQFGSTPQMKSFGSTFSNSPITSRSQTPDAGRNVNSSSTPSLSGASQKQRNEEYFARLSAQNALRRDDIPPSQGGKYSGFGSSTYHGNSADSPSTPGSTFSVQGAATDPAVTLSKGWSLLASSAQSALSTLGTVAGTINDSYIRPTSEKIQDPNFRNDMSSYVSAIGHRMEEQANRGFTSLSTYMRSGQQSLGASGSGYSPVPTNGNEDLDNTKSSATHNTYESGIGFFDKELEANASLTPPASASTASLQANSGISKRSSSRNLQPTGAATGRGTNPRAGIKQSKGWDDEWDNF
ncbi:ArfGap-domain-containing protein [Coemansia reversa NRRL 1564]|uniref:ArfGap-domain-containing protein n=1 Tax=Coemansia reversa (strain ATCC 12441 / NRRL 1564) TaxID=763665 RepID=A0A2G5BGR6_COERN|nr:ArfGap-domain-containing protein [Coemansia reversa NRRL 1564]|eukprot:PIA18193.1 ArfGap-domain-containing protein [Coemansia reversa NRRL 1564]